MHFSRMKSDEENKKKIEEKWRTTEYKQLFPDSNLNTKMNVTTGQIESTLMVFQTMFNRSFVVFIRTLVFFSFFFIRSAFVIHVFVLFSLLFRFNSIAHIGLLFVKWMRRDWYVYIFATQHMKYMFMLSFTCNFKFYDPKYSTRFR